MAATRVSRKVFSGNALRESVTFRDDAGDPFVPSTLEYRVINREDDSVITDWATVPSIAADMTIIFDDSNFQTEDTSKASEVHEVTLFPNRQVAGFKASFVYDVEVIRAGV